MARQFGWNLSVLSIGGVSPLAYFSNVRIAVSVTTDMARSPYDTNPSSFGIPGADGWRYPVEKSRRWTLECGTFLEGIPSLFDLVLAGAAVAVLLTGGGHAFSGTACFTAGELDMPDGPMTQNVTLIGDGPLTVLT